MIIRDVNLETVCGVTSKLPDNTLPEFAFAGKSNVGKSSLINEDFPTFDFPAKANSGSVLSGSLLVTPQTVSRFTSLMIIQMPPLLLHPYF